MNKSLEILINDKLNSIQNDNKMLNCNFDMKFKILEKFSSIERTYINYKMKEIQNNFNKKYSSETINNLMKYLNKIMEIIEIPNQDLYYSLIENNKKCYMNYFTSWFYMNDGEIIINKINPIRDEILNLISQYTKNMVLKYYTIK